MKKRSHSNHKTGASWPQLWALPNRLKNMDETRIPNRAPPITPNGDKVNTPVPWQTGRIAAMSSALLETSPGSEKLYEICDRLKAMGYAESKRIRIYGQDFEVVSNPFPQGDGVAIQAISKKEMRARILQLPLPVLQMAIRKKPAQR